MVKKLLLKPEFQVTDLEEILEHEEFNILSGALDSDDDSDSESNSDLT